MRNLLALLIGVGFGVLLVKSEVSSWFRIQKMFAFQQAHMYLIMGSAVTVAAVSIQILRRWRCKSVFGEPITLKGKPFTQGTWIGGLLFGAGWCVTGACPGPIYAQLGKGEWIALFSFAGAFCGAYLYAILKPKLPE